MRIATYNVEWFNDLFDPHGNLIADDGWSGRRNVTRIEQITALGIVFTALDADAIMVIEAPDGSAKRSGERALENFSRHFGLRARRALMGFVNDTQQEITFLYDPDKIRARHDPKGAQTGKKGSRDAPRFDGVFLWDLNVDADPERIRFSKPPLEVAMTTIEKGNRLHLIGVHAKSKAPHGARGKKQMMRIAIDNRRKQLAQCIWIRKRVDGFLARHEPLIVLGDFNDGPGLDEYEKLFGHSGIEIVLGENGHKTLFDPHAHMVLSRKVGAWPVTSRFFIKQQNRFLSALLDYIMVSPDLMAKHPEWRIWHPFDDPVCYQTPELREALLTASDHFPVSIDIDL